MGCRGRRPLRNRKECAEWDVEDAVPYEVARSARNGTSRTPSPTKSQRGRCKKGGQVSALYIPIIYDSAQRHDAL